MDFTVANKKVYAYTGGRAFDATLPTVVFIHGGEHDHCVWVLQSRYLAHHGFSVLALDLPGHGRTAGPALESVPLLADWIVAVLKAAGVSRATLVGHSMGSLVALECASRYHDHVEKIVLIGTAFPMRVSPELLDATKNNEPVAHEMVNVWSHAHYAHYPSNPGPGFWVVGENLRLMQRQAPGVMHVDFAACNSYDRGIEAAKNVQCPALVISGKRDLMTPPRAATEMVKSLKQCRTVEVTGGGHALMAEKPDDVLDHLRSFL